jgi:2-hydroxychromene-2-carboxylate isomerase
MSKTIDYFLAPISPWTYLGHGRFVELAKRHGADVNVKPMDLGVVFSETGGLPLAKRAPQRQAYRLVELKRWHEFLAMPMNIEPKFFPTSSALATRLIIAVARELPQQALTLAGHIMAVTWADDADMAAPEVLAERLRRSGLDAERWLKAAQEPWTAEVLAANSREAIGRGVFGSPSYIYGDELFWGQDRLDFLERALMA